VHGQFHHSGKTTASQEVVAPHWQVISSFCVFAPLELMHSLYKDKEGVQMTLRMTFALITLKILEGLRVFGVILCGSYAHIHIFP
jgi:hypothetical protein